MSDSQPFVLNSTSMPFQNLLKAKEQGDDQFNMMSSAIAMAFGLDSETVVVDAFDTEMKAVKNRGIVEDYVKEMSGHTLGAALIAKLTKGLNIAKDAGGSVTFGITVTLGEGDKPTTASVTPRFGGVTGVSASRGGGQGRGKGRYQYFDGGAPIEGSLKKYIQNKYPNSHAGLALKKNDADLASGKNGRLSAFVAATDGMKKGDSFVITRGEKKAVDSSK